jgi:hypothetical protein
MENESLAAPFLSNDQSWFHFSADESLTVKADVAHLPLCQYRK